MHRDQRIAEIDETRARRNIGENEFSELAGLSLEHWRELRCGTLLPASETVLRLQEALRALPMQCTSNVIIADTRAAEHLLVETIGNDRALIAALAWRRHRRRRP